MKIIATRLGGIPERARADQRLTALSEWGRRLSHLGIAPGASGNVSVRDDEGFVITRTEVELGSIHADDWVLVTGLERRQDGALEVTYRGDLQHPPSRDSFVHGTIYDRVPAAQAIFHLHDRDIVDQADRLGIPSTQHFHPAGTSESVAEIERFLQGHPAADYFVLVEHGIVAWATDIDTAGRLVEAWHHRVQGENG